MSIIVCFLDSGGSERMLTVDHYEIIRRKVRGGMSQRDVATMCRLSVLVQSTCSAFLANVMSRRA